MTKSDRGICVLMACAMIATVVSLVMPTNVCAQNTPPEADAGGPYVGAEGSPITFDASESSDDDPEDQLQYRWDFHNDGIWDTSYSIDPTATYTWYDDYSGIVVVNVTDSLSNDTATANVTVTNVDPAPEGTADIDVNEGDMFPIQIVFFDPGTMDTFLTTVTINGDGDGNGDNGNGNGGHGGLPQLTLDSISYESVILHMTLHTNNYAVNDLELQALEGSLISRLTAEGTTHTLTPPTGSHYHVFGTDIPRQSSSSVDVGMEPNPDTGIWALQWEITYNGTRLSAGFFSNMTAGISLTIDKFIPDDCSRLNHTVTIETEDDDGGIGVHHIYINVTNLPPTVKAGPDQTVVEGDIVHFNGSYEDPGWLDTHEIVWDFGDGNTAEDTLKPEHRYGEPGTYTVTLNVTDDDGDWGTDTLLVTVEPQWDITLILTILAIIIIIIVVAVVSRLVYARTTERKERTIEERKRRRPPTTKGEE